MPLKREEFCTLKIFNSLISLFCISTLVLTVILFISGTARTQLKAGETINITWHLAYPHKVTFCHIEKLLVTRKMPNI